MEGERKDEKKEVYTLLIFLKESQPHGMGRKHGMVAEAIPRSYFLFSFFF